MNIHDHSFDAKTEAVIEKVRKLLALAKGNDNEHQAEAATNKAMELLEAYNLDMAVLSKTQNSFTPRNDQKLRGGLYKWQRDLWNMTATLNFCRYSFYRGLSAGSSYEHRLIGSKANVISTTVMAQYLQDTIDRMAKNWVNEYRPGKSVFIKEAIAYREGVAERVIWKMWELRESKLREEKFKQQEDRARNKAQGINTENALVLADVISTEEDLNADHVNGWPPGRSAQLRKERELRKEAAERAAEELMKEQAAWDEAHPAEAAARKAKEKAEYDRMMKDSDAKWDKDKRKQQRARKATPEEERRRLDSFHVGYKDGKDVSLDKQVNVNNRRMIE